MERIRNFKKGIYTGFMLAFLCFMTQTIKAQETALKQELINALNEKGFDDFVIEMNEFLEKAPAMMAREASNSKDICPNDLEYEEVLFAEHQFEKRVFESSELKNLMQSYVENISFWQSSSKKCSTIYLTPNQTLEAKLGAYVRSGIGLKTVIHSMTFEDGTSSKETFTFEDAMLKLSTVKKVKEIEATITLEYPTLKVYTVEDHFKKITIGDESIVIGIKDNSVLISVPEKNSDFLTINSSLQIEAIHESKKTLESISSFNDSKLDSVSFDDITKTIEIIETLIENVNSKHITNSEQLLLELDKIPNSGVQSNWLHTFCYNGKVDKVLFFYNLKDDQTVTKKVTMKAYF